MGPSQGTTLLFETHGTPHLLSHAVLLVTSYPRDTGPFGTRRGPTPLKENGGDVVFVKLFYVPVV